MQVAEKWYHHGDAQSIIRRGSWREGGPEKGGGGLRGSSVQTSGVHPKEWDTA